MSRKRSSRRSCRGHPVAVEQRPGAPLEALEGGREGPVVADQLGERLDQVVTDRRIEQPERAHEARVARDHGGAHLERADDARRVQRAGTAARDEHVLAQVLAPPRRRAADGADHVLLEDRDHPERGVLRARAEAVTELGQGRARELAVERELAADQPGGRQAAEHEVRVGHGRLGAALPVADRVRARRPRSPARR